MADTDYVFLKDMNGTVIKPVTDLAAINLTTINGVVVQGNTIGILGDYVADCYKDEVMELATAGAVTVLSS